MQYPSPLGLNPSVPAESPYEPNPFTRLPGVFSILDPAICGARDDNAQDNASAFADLSAFINEIPLGYPPPYVIIPRGYLPYYTTGGFTFTREVRVRHEGGIINYGGEGYVYKMGPDGLTDADIPNHKVYDVIDPILMGGLGMEHGIYFNTRLTQARVVRPVFFSFGGTTSYAVFFQSSNWDSRVINPRWCVDSLPTAQTRNGIRLEGITTGGVQDIGQSRLIVTNGLLIDQSFGSGIGNAGVGIWINGETAVLDSTNVSGFQVNVHLGSFASYSSFIHCYFETINAATECFRFGDTSGPDMGTFMQYCLWDDCYCNLHNTDSYNTVASFIGFNELAATSAGFQFCTVNNVRTAAQRSTIPLVRQANLASQTGNVANNNRGWTILHTAGGPIDNWSGVDGP